MYGSLAIVGFVAGIVFYVLFGRALDEPVTVLESVEAGVPASDEEAVNGKSMVVTANSKEL